MPTRSPKEKQTQAKLIFLHIFAWETCARTAGKKYLRHGHAKQVNDSCTIIFWIISVTIFKGDMFRDILDNLFKPSHLFFEINASVNFRETFLRSEVQLNWKQFVWITRWIALLFVLGPVCWSDRHSKLTLDHIYVLKHTAQFWNKLKWPCWHFNVLGTQTTDNNVAKTGLGWYRMIFRSVTASQVSGYMSSWECMYFAKYSDYWLRYRFGTDTLRNLNYAS